MSGFPHTSPDAIIRALARGEDPLAWASALLHSALDYSTEEDTARSLVNCHVPGLDSIVLWSGGEGGGMIRFYLSHAGVSPLHNLIGPDGHFTVGVHNHRYRIAKIPLNNALVNWRTRAARFSDPVGGDDPVLYEYGFQSGITGKMGVTGGEPRKMTHGQPDVLVPGDVTIMEPHDLHTVVTPRRLDTAWLVVEGTNVPNFQPLIYSPRPDLSLTDEGLYEKPSFTYIRNTIHYALYLLEPNS